MKKASEIITKIEEDKKTIEFLPTGFKKVDEFLDGGFLRKEMIILGGFTGIGKSFLAGQMLWNLALKGFKTAYFSLEISNEMVVARLMGAIANIKPTKLTAGLITADEQDRKLKAKAKLLSHEDFVDFYDDLYEYEKIRQAIIDNGYEFVVIDFIQNIMIRGNFDEYAKLSFVSLALQKLAKETNCCILLLSQLSNEKAKNGSQGNVEYKGSGSIATVCDLGFVITRDEMQKQINHFTVTLMKNRRGVSGVNFSFAFRHPGGWISENA